MCVSYASHLEQVRLSKTLQSYSVLLTHTLRSCHAAHDIRAQSLPLPRNLQIIVNVVIARAGGRCIPLVSVRHGIIPNVTKSIEFNSIVVATQRPSAMSVTDSRNPSPARLLSVYVNVWIATPQGPLSAVYVGGGRLALSHCVSEHSVPNCRNNSHSRRWMIMTQARLSESWSQKPAPHPAPHHLADACSRWDFLRVFAGVTTSVRRKYPKPWWMLEAASGVCPSDSVSTVLYYLSLSSAQLESDCECPEKAWDFFHDSVNTTN